VSLTQTENFVPAERFNPPNYLNTRNRLVNLETGDTEDHRPDFIGTIQLSFDVDPRAKPSLWIQTTKEILPAEADRQLLQQIFGYCLTTDTSYHKAFIFEGEGSNGKSVVLAVLNALLSDANVSHLFLSDFKERFRLVQLYHKLVNITPEVRSGELIDDASFKALVAGDPVTVEQKYKNAFTFRPHCKFIIATNALIPTRDFSHGFLRRLVIIPFTQTFDGARIDRHRAEKIISSELPGIFNWAMIGLKSLRQKGEFIQTDSTTNALEEYRLDVDKILSFIHDEVVLGPAREVEFGVLYGHYQWWCTENGVKAISAKSFAKRFLKITKSDGVKVVESHGNRPYKGCELKPRRDNYMTQYMRSGQNND
jgi:putative DNA primase/helicase